MSPNGLDFFLVLIEKIIRLLNCKHEARKPAVSDWKTGQGNSRSCRNQQTFCTKFDTRQGKFALVATSGRWISQKILYHFVRTAFCSDERPPKPYQPERPLSQVAPPVAQKPSWQQRRESAQASQPSSPPAAPKGIRLRAVP